MHNKSYSHYLQNDVIRDFEPLWLSVGSRQDKRQDVKLSVLTLPTKILAKLFIRSEFVTQCTAIKTIYRYIDIYLGESNVSLVTNDNIIVRSIPRKVDKLGVPYAKLVVSSVTTFRKDADGGDDVSVVGRLFDVCADFVKYFFHTCNMPAIAKCQRIPSGPPWASGCIPPGRSGAELELIRRQIVVAIFDDLLHHDIPSLLVIGFVSINV